MDSASSGLGADDELAAQGLYIDDIHRVRILEPSLADQTLQLKTECDRFLQSKYRPRFFPFPSIRK